MIEDVVYRHLPVALRRFRVVQDLGDVRLILADGIVLRKPLIDVAFGYRSP